MIFVSGLITGLFLGLIFGVLIVALCNVADHRD